MIVTPSTSLSVLRNVVAETECVVIQSNSVLTEQYMAVLCDLNF